MTAELEDVNKKVGGLFERLNQNDISAQVPSPSDLHTSPSNLLVGIFFGKAATEGKGAVLAAAVRAAWVHRVCCVLCAVCCAVTVYAVCCALCAVR